MSFLWFEPEAILASATAQDWLSSATPRLRFGPPVTPAELERRERLRQDVRAEADPVRDAYAVGASSLDSIPSSSSGAISSLA